MKNWEKYEKEIKEFGIQGFYDLAVKDGEVVNCNDIGCNECDLHTGNHTPCSTTLIEWLYTEAAPGGDK